MRRRSLVRFFCLLVVLASFNGCLAPPTDSDSDRPWNTPRSWENGIPNMMRQGR